MATEIYKIQQGAHKDEWALPEQTFDSKTKKKSTKVRYFKSKTDLNNYLKETKTPKKYSKTELNKAAQHFFNKNYDELTVESGDKGKAYQRVKSGEGKFSKVTQADPLTEIQQNKILKEYPNAKFTPTNKFGFPPGHENYQKVEAFVSRGYKKPFQGSQFQALPKYAQQELIEAFPEVKFDFERDTLLRKGSKFSKYGILVAHPKYNKITKYFAKSKPWKYNFDLRSPEGWMMSQMERNYAQNGEASPYRPITKKGGPIAKGNPMIGIEHNGKKYNMKTIVDHPDFDNTRKYWNIADKTSKKYLSEFDNLVKLLPEGFDPKKIQVNDLLQFISDKDGVHGLNRAKRAIVMHHEYGVGPRATTNYQLLRQDMNLLANKANNLIKKGGLSNIEKGAADALAKGVRLNVEGVQYGPEKVSARGDIKSIISQAETEMQKFTKKDWNKFSSLLENLGCPGKASGGRVGFQGGTNCAVKGRYLATELFGKGTANTEQKQILNEILRMGSGLMRGVGQMLNPKEFFRLRNLIGPGAWAAMGAFEAGVIGYETINNNTPLNEVLSDNWVTGWAMPWTKKEAQIENLEKANISGSPAMQKYMEQVKLMAEYEREYKALDAMKAGITTPMGETKFSKLELQDQEEKLYHLNKEWSDLQATPEGGGELEFQKAVSDMAGERKAGHYDPSDLRNINEYGYADVGESAFKGLPLIGDWFKQGTPIKKDPQILRKGLPPQLSTSGYHTIPKYDVDLTKYEKQPGVAEATTTPVGVGELEGITQYMRDVGYRHPRFGEMSEEDIELIQAMKKWRQLFAQSPTGLHGARFAGGGLTRTVAPGSEGILSLKKK